MQELGHQLFLIMIGTAIVGVLLQPATWVLLTLLTPKQLLEKYFKEPYFTAGELVVMSQFPMSLVRTGIFGGALVLPWLDRKRKMQGCVNSMPRWYRIWLRTFTISNMIIFILFFGIMGILFLMDWLDPSI